MTADAKVGLLLGLVFIVLIAFLINGLPGFLSAPSKLEVLPSDPVRDRDLILNKNAGEVVTKINPEPTLREPQAPARDVVIKIQDDKPEIPTPAPQPKTEPAQPKEPIASGNVHTRFCPVAGSKRFNRPA